MESNADRLSPLKRRELELLTAFLSVCEQLELPYYIAGGTLLGAVRHKGFIPWDDDIDIAMLRKDYEVFIAKAPALLPDFVFLQNIHTEPEFLANFTKLRHCDTTFIESSWKFRKINHGIFIDIFPFDYYPDSKLKRLRFRILDRLYKLRIASECFYKKKTLKQKISHPIAKLLMPSVKKTLRKRDKLIKACSGGSCIANHSGVWGKKEVIPAKWFDHSVKLEFEGLQVNAPGDYHLFLSHYYGDYMQLPPIEKQVSHHRTEIIDPETPYTHYI